MGSRGLAAAVITHTAMRIEKGFAELVVNTWENVLTSKGTPIRLDQPK